jgi:hypothetical protein
MPVIPAFERLKQENCKFKAKLGYVVRPCVKAKQKTQNHQQQPQSQDGREVVHFKRWLEQEA